MQFYLTFVMYSYTNLIKMKNTINTEKPLLSFSDAYEGFHPVVRREIKAKIIGFTGWSRITFYNKKNQVHKITLPEQRIIECVFMDYGVDAWTGKEITTNINIT